MTQIAKTGIFDNFSAACVHAIAHQKLAGTAREALASGRLAGTPEAETLAETALAACAAISGQMTKVQGEALAALAARGIQAEPKGTALAAGTAQFHSCDIAIRRPDLGPALEVLGDLGFDAAITFSPARLRVAQRHLTALKLIRMDGDTTRINLHFDNAAASRLPSRLRPGVVDLAAWSLPRPLAAAYLAAKPLRLLCERLTGWRSPHHEVDFLGTPDGLVEPILRSVGLTADDVFLDVGCGDGRVVVKVAELFGCEARGIEHNPALVTQAQARIDASHARKLMQVTAGDARTADLGRTTVAFLFLPVGVLAEILPAVIQAAPPHTRIIVHEQSLLAGLPQSRSAHPVVCDAGITVVHVFEGRATV